MVGADWVSRVVDYEGMLSQLQLGVLVRKVPAWVRFGYDKVPPLWNIEFHSHYFVLEYPYVDLSRR